MAVRLDQQEFGRRLFSELSLVQSASTPELCRALQRIFLRIHVVNTIAYDVITGFGFRQQLIAHAVDQDRMLTRTEVASEGNADCKRAQNGHSKLNSAVHEPLSV